MRLLEVKIKNFMPYKGLQKISFPSHETQNVMLLFGDNMRGKTSFLNSIRWGLYGNAIGRHLRPIARANLINRDAVDEGDWHMSVSLNYEHSARSYELTREIRRKEHVSLPKPDSDFDEVVGLRIDGEAIPSDSIVNEVNQVIPEEISRFFLFDGELLQEYENLLIDESDQGEKIKQHIEQILGVPSLVHGRDEFNVLMKEARRIQAADAKKNKQLKTFAEQQRQLEIQLESKERNKSDLDAQQRELQEELDGLDDELQNTEAVQNKKVELESLKTEIAGIDKNVQSLADEERLLIKSAWKDVLHGTVKSVLLGLTEKRDALQQALLDRTARAARIEDLERSLDDPVCPTCKQVIPDPQIFDIKNRLDALKAEQELSIVDAGEIKKTNEMIDKLQKIEAADECQRILSLNTKKRRLAVDLIKAETRLEDLQDEIKGFDTDYIMRQREKRDRVVALMDRVKKDLDTCVAAIEKNTKEQDHIAALISKSEGAKGQISSIRVQIYQQLEAVFSKGIDRLRDELRSRVEASASKAFKKLTTEESYSGLQINNNYGLSILDQKHRVLKERSAGAEQIVALALIDGLNRTSKNTGPIIMDTPLGRLDPKHRSNVLKYLPDMAEQVVLLVHEGEINPERDLRNFAHRIGLRYKIDRISATESVIRKVV